MISVCLVPYSAEPHHLRSPRTGVADTLRLPRPPSALHPSRSLAPTHLFSLARLHCRALLPYRDNKDLQDDVWQPRDFQCRSAEHSSGEASLNKRSAARHSGNITPGIVTDSEADGRFVSQRAGGRGGG